MKLNLSATILKFSKIIVKFLFSVIKVLSRLFLLPLIFLSPVIIYHLQYDLDNNTSIIRGISFIILFIVSALLLIFDASMLMEDDKYSLHIFYKWVVANSVYIEEPEELETPSTKEIEGHEYISGQWMNEKLNKDNSVPPIGSWNGS